MWQSPVTRLAYLLATDSMELIPIGCFHGIAARATNRIQQNPVPVFLLLQSTALYKHRVHLEASQLREAPVVGRC